LSTGDLAVIMVFGIPIIAILCASLVQLAKILQEGSGRVRRGHAEEETRLVQHIYEQLQRMEHRIEALETIIVSTDRKGVHS
jgi:phage shock protein B